MRPRGTGAACKQRGELSGGQERQIADIVRIPVVCGQKLIVDKTDQLLIDKAERRPLQSARFMVLKAVVPEGKEEKGQMKDRDRRALLMEAPIPSWLKYALLEAKAGKRTYLDVGYHLGKHVGDFDVDEQAVLDEVDDESFARPTAALRRIFANEGHPRGELVDWVPRRRRRDVLKGMLCQVGGYTVDELS